MGVKYLWTVLAPFCDRKPLYELQGKTVAVDLSCWICEAQNIAEYQVQPRMYLRNLYFRTCYLLLMDVNPVFVLEGKAPELKYDTILARNAVQFKGAKPKADGVKTGRDRTRFHFVLRQCEEMLSYMGLECIKGNGEAESLCAYLNEDGLVDGCISQDSDCFAYGARVVYRNFSISTQGAQAASGGAVDVYDIRKANHSLSFGRNKIVAMALLTGCDYSDGVHGVGKDSVLKFFEIVSDDEVLDKLRSWRKNKYIYESYEKLLTDKTICTSCGHSGKIQAHTKNGCASCKTTSGCNPFNYKNERLNMKNEVNMRNKAIKDPNFPDEVLIKEFLDRKDNVRELDLKWKQPNVVKFLKFTTKFLQWEELYAFEKILPILTRWQCKNPELLKNEDNLKGSLKPVRIKKVRNPKGVSSYEIIWSDPGECFKGLVPESQILENNIDLEKLWSTIEPQNLVKNAYPHLVESFKQSKIKPKKISKRKNNINEITEQLDNVSIAESKSKKPRKPRVGAGQKTVAAAIKTSAGRFKNIETTQTDLCLNDLDSSFKQLTIKNSKTGLQNLVGSDVDNRNSSLKQKEAPKAKTRTLDSFVKKTVANCYKQQRNEIGFNNEKQLGNKEYVDNIEIFTSSTPLKGAKTDNSFDISSFGDESGLDLSEIIDDIVSRKDVKDDLKFVADKYVQCLTKGVEGASWDVTLQKDNFDVCQHSLPSGRNEDCKRSDIRKNKFKEIHDQLENFKCNIDVAESGNSQNDLNNASREDTNQVSNFFVSNPGNEHDLFEKTFNETFKNFEDSSESDTEEYEYEINDLTSDKEEEENSRRVIEGFVEEGHRKILLTSDEDSFDDNEYVPLYERLKNK